MMNRVKSNGHYLLIFGLAYLGINILVGLFQGLLFKFFGFAIPFLGSPVALFAALVVTRRFLKYEGRYPEKEERNKLIFGSLFVWFGLMLLFALLIAAIILLVVGFEGVEDVSSQLAGGGVLFVIIFILLALATPFNLLMIYLGYAKFRSKGVMRGPSKDEPLFPQTEEYRNATESFPINDSNGPVTGANKSDTWQPVDDRNSGFSVREERAPIGKYAVGLLALLLVGGGAIWLASKVVIADDVPTIERADKPTKEPKPQAPKSADDLAWVKALETDTVEGYRAYLAAFPNGRHVEDAQRLLNEFDEEAWKLADERDTIQGYEDYLESWPEGLHATEARDRIAKIKAEEEARRKNAQEAARQEAAAWKTAAEANTIPSYEGYLSKFPTGKNAPEAQTRIERLRADEARRQASAADETAWRAATATNTADAYQQYLTSYPQGAHVPEAIAKLEELRPGPGKTFKDCATCPTMVTLPAGTAELGAADTDGKAKPNEKPARPVTFTTLFAIGVTEVTFDQYGACVSAGVCKSMPSDNGWGQGSRPVINVSWSDAVAYAQWLSNTTGKRYSLPSDAQWEYAARGGDTGLYPGGSAQALCAFANGAAKESELPWANTACTDLSADRTLPAGSLSKNKFGVADMLGNVSEWVLDCNTLNLRDAPVDGSSDARGSCSQRIVRGGSWFSGPDDMRYSARAVQRRGDTNDFTGFRVVRN